MKPVIATGANIIAGVDRTDGPAMAPTTHPRDGSLASVVAKEATPTEVEDACRLAAEAQAELIELGTDTRADLLRLIADSLESLEDELVETADIETGLGAEPRLTSELARASNQFRFFADVISDEACFESMMDLPDNGPPVRRVLVPLGPAAVFGASNFPFAFSVSGGDTASALAAGCTVIAKAHPSHPLTSEMTARIIANAIDEVGFPAGSFSLIHGFRAGYGLVTNPHLTSVAFTGSVEGGLGLQEAVSKRDIPIPVYAEMGSTNPVVISPMAARTYPNELASGYVASFTTGTGQFCTKPGLTFVPAGKDGTELVQSIGELVAVSQPTPMLNHGIRDAWSTRMSEWRVTADVREVGSGQSAGESAGILASPVVFETSTENLVATPMLQAECFGPSTLLVRYQDTDDLVDALRTLVGNLAGAVHADESERGFVLAVCNALLPRVGRLIWNGWTTGVIVTRAMHHGGPFPATTNPLHTSVGATAIRRFLRPIAYQGDFPLYVLPQVLHR